MLTRLYYGPDAVSEGERYGLKLINKNKHLAQWLPLAYNVAKLEFMDPRHIYFEYNLYLDVVTKHTTFSKFILELVYYSHLGNLPVRSLNNGLGDSNFAALLLAFYVVFVYLRVA